MGVSEVAKVRDTAIDRVLLPVDGSSQARALHAVYWLAVSRREFTTFDVRESAPGVDFGERRAWGGIMRAASRLKFCTPTDRYQQGRSLASHGRPERVWKSLVYVEPKASGTLFSQMKEGA